MGVSVSCLPFSDSTRHAAVDSVYIWQQVGCFLSYDTLRAVSAVSKLFHTAMSHCLKHYPLPYAMTVTKPPTKLFGVAPEHDGFTYYASRTRHVIFKFRYAPNRECEAIAGMSDKRGYVDGPSFMSRLARPRGLAVDREGFVYFTDANGRYIRVVSPTGTVATLAGQPTKGYVDGVGTQAKFGKACCLAVDAERNVYVADKYNNAIRKITREGVVSTVLYSGKGEMQKPEAVAVDANGVLYVVAGKKGKVLKIML